MISSFLQQPAQLFQCYFTLPVFKRVFKIGRMDVILLSSMKLAVLQIYKTGTAEVPDKSNH